MIGQRVLLPLDNLLRMAPWSDLASAVAPGFVTPHNGLILDMIIQNYGWKRFLADQVRHGHIPLWNPYLLGGAPFLAAGQYQVLYPFGALFLVLPAAWAYGPYTALHLALAGLFTFGYLRLIGEARPGAVLAAITFAFCGSLVTSVLWPQMVGAMVWLPAVLAAVELVLRADRPPRAAAAAALGGVVIALQILAGHLEISFYVLSTAAGYTVWRLAPLFWRPGARRAALGRAGLLLLMGLAGVGLAGVQLWPFAEAIGRNVREGSVTLADVRGWALPVRQVITFLVPDFFGNPTQHTYINLFSGQWTAVGPRVDGQPTDPPETAFWGVKNYVEAASYVGLLPLLLAPLGVVGRRHRFAGFFGVAAVVALLLAFGSPLYGLLFRFVPGFSQVHTAFRWVYVYSFAVAALAGMGANWVLEQSRRLGRPLRLRLFGLLALVLGVAATLVAVGTFLLKGPFAATLQGRLAADAARPKDQWFLATHLHDGQEWFSLVWQHGAWAALVLLVAGVLIWAGLSLRHGARRQRVLAVALPALVAVDLFAVNMPFNTMADPRLLSLIPAQMLPSSPPSAHQPPALTVLRQRAAIEPPFRIASYGPQDVLAPDAALLYGLQDVRGYDTIVLRRYADFLNLIEPQLENLNTYSQTTKTFQNPATLDSPLLDLLGVRYVLSTQPIGDSLYRLVGAGPVFVYENTGALPRAFMVYHATAVPDATSALRRLAQPGFQPATEAVLEGPPSLTMVGDAVQAPVTISSYGASSISLDVTTPQPGYLVLADTYFPGWTVRVRPGGTTQGDWQEAPVLPADEAFRAIALAPGHWTVEFRYQPLSFRAGLVLSSFSAGVLLLLLAVAAWDALSRRWDLEGSAARRVAKNAISPMLSSLTNKVLDFGFNVFTAALIGPAGIGRFAEAVAVVGLMGTVQDFGLGTITMRDVANERGLATRYFTNTLLLRLALALLALPVVAAIAVAGLTVGAYDRLTVLTLWLLVAGFFPGSVASAASAVLKASERFEAPAFVEVAGNLVRIFLGAVTLLLGWNVVGLATTSLVVNLFNAVALTVAARGLLRWRGRWLDTGLCRYLLRDSFPLMLNNLLNLVFFRVDVVLLSFLSRDNAAVGYYSVAYKFIDGLGFISSYLTFALFPQFSRLARSAGDSFRTLYVFALRLLVAVALPATAVVVVLADRIIGLFYPAFGPAVLALRILIFFLVFSYVNGVTQYALIARDRQRLITAAFVAGVAFNVGANLLLIPRLGIDGAALVTVLSELVLLVPFLGGIWSAVRPLPLGLIVLRPALAALGAGAVAVAFHGASWALLIPACLVAYPALFLLLGGLPAADRRRLVDLFARRSAPAGEAV